VAIEPVTHASDGFNRLEHGQRGGVRVLAPGETLAVRYELEFARA
jgi:galactose mutarotase-like enzyme